MKSLRPVLCAALALAAQPAASQQASPILRSGAAEISVGGRVHVQLNTSSEDSVAVQEWLLRRVRLETTVKVNDWVGGRVQVDFAGNRVSVKDAYLSMELDPAFRITAGNMHRPFGNVTQTSSNRMLPVERGVRIRGLGEVYDEHNLVLLLGYADRDVGLQIAGAPRNAPLGFFYAAGLFNGPARRSEGRDETYQLVGRLGVRPARSVTAAVSASRRDFVEDDESLAGVAWSADLEIGGYDPGFHFLGEAVIGDFDPFQDAEFFGAQGWLAYRTGKLGSRVEHLEPVIRVSHGDPDRRDEDEADLGGLLITPGLNIYVGGMSRIMLNADFWDGADGNRASSFKTQFQLAF